MTSTHDRASTVEKALLDAIEEGEYAPGDRLPPIAELAERWQTNKNTVSKVIQRLKGMGVLTGRAGGYTRVRAPHLRITRRQPERYIAEKMRALLPESERRKTGASEMDTGLSKDDFDFNATYSTVEADDEKAQLFGVEPGALLLARDYTTRANGSTTVGHGRSYLRHNVASQNPALLDAANEPWPGGTHNQLRTVGIEVARIEDHITARPPMPDEAEALGLDQGVSVLVFRKLSYSTTGDLAEMAEFVLPGDRSELVYSIELPEWSA